MATAGDVVGGGDCCLLREPETADGGRGARSHALGVKQYMTSKNRESWEINSYILNMGEILVMYGGQANIAHPNTLRGHP